MTEQERRDLEEFRQLMAQLAGREKAVKACLMVLKGQQAAKGAGNCEDHH